MCKGPIFGYLWFQQQGHFKAYLCGENERFESTITLKQKAKVVGKIVMLSAVIVMAGRRVDLDRKR